MSIDRILAAAASQPWALMPEKLAEIRAFLELRASGVRFDAAEIEARTGPGRTGRSAEARSGLVAVIPVIGIMTQRGSMLDAISGPGGVSSERVGAQLREAVADPDVRAILMEFDTPGGSTFGVEELADEIRRARDRKTVVAQVNSTAASAGYWAASGAGEIVLTPGGMVGSIGVYGMHDDLTGAMEKAGVRKTYISAGPYKTEGNPFEPLSDEARDHLQSRVNATYEKFVDAVARGRKTTAARVRAEFGKGRTVDAPEALRVGMVDRIGTMTDTLRRLISGASSSGGAGALASMVASTDIGQLSADERRERHDERLRDDFRRRRHLHRVRSAGHA